MVVSKEIAIQDVNRWLDYKRVRASKREDYKQHIDSLVAAIQDGLLTVEEDHTITQHLLFEIGEGGTKELKFKPRLTQEQLNPYISKLASGSADERLRAYICALTGQAVGIISKLDTEDNTISQSIAVFFL
jgi:hypothetical protein